jgi:hypothetical protein
MAREAHRRLVTEDYPGHTGQLDPWTMTLLARFAALVAAAEREACAKLCDKYYEAACKFESKRRTHSYIMGKGARSCAHQIRARGQQRPEPTYPSDPIWREQKRLEMEAWARNKLARHGIQLPGDDDGPLAF